MLDADKEEARRKVEGHVFRGEVSKRGEKVGSLASDELMLHDVRE